MSKYKQHPMDFAALKTIPIAERGGKINVEDFGSPYPKGAGISGLVDSLPRILAGNSLRELTARAIR